MCVEIEKKQEGKAQIRGEGEAVLSSVFHIEL